MGLVWVSEGKGARGFGWCGFGGGVENVQGLGILVLVNSWVLFKRFKPSEEIKKIDWG